MSNQWRGFYAPRYTQVPNDLFDLLLPDLGLAELKVLLYIMRQTFGFHKDADAISLSQLEQGTGLSRKSIAPAVASLVERGMVQVERAKSNGRSETNVYSLVLLEERGGYATPPPAAGVVTLSNQGREVTSLGVGTQGNTQKNVEIKDEIEDAPAPVPLEDMPLDEREALIRRYQNLLPKRR
jgi:phage replication O-like protein O